MGGSRVQEYCGFDLLPLEGQSVAVACSSSQILGQLHADANGSEALTFENITCVHSLCPLCQRMDFKRTVTESEL